MIVSLISQKGGVGKSALARLIGVDMARAGWRVLIADLDAAQGTSTLWKVRRDQIDAQPDLDVLKVRTVARALTEAARYDLTILDGPAHADRSALPMARASDLVLLPAGYSLDDLEPQARVAFELEQGAIDPDRIRIALARVRGSAKEGQAVRDYLRRAGLIALDGELRELPSIRAAYTQGLCASETSHPRVNVEAAKIAAEVAALLTRKEPINEQA